MLLVACGQVADVPVCEMTGNIERTGERNLTAKSEVH